MLTEMIEPEIQMSAENVTYEPLVIWRLRGVARQNNSAITQDVPVYEDQSIVALWRQGDTSLERWERIFTPDGHQNVTIYRNVSGPGKFDGECVERIDYMQQGNGSWVGSKVLIGGARGPYELYPYADVPLYPLLDVRDAGQEKERRDA